jgi:hypothetical protein
LKPSIHFPILILAFLFGLLFLLKCQAIAGNFDPFTGQYDGAQPAHAIREHNEAFAQLRQQKLDWMRAHYVPGHTLVSEHGDMTVTKKRRLPHCFKPMAR